MIYMLNLINGEQQLHMKGYYKTFKEVEDALFSDSPTNPWLRGKHYLFAIIEPLTEGIHPRKIEGTWYHNDLLKSRWTRFDPKKCSFGFNVVHIRPSLIAS